MYKNLYLSICLYAFVNYLCQTEAKKTQTDTDINMIPEENKTEAIEQTHRFATLSRTLVNYLKTQLDISNLNEQSKAIYAKSFDQLEWNSIAVIIQNAEGKLSILNMQYIICFIIGMYPNDIARLFKVDVNSVYSTRYRIKKKIGRQEWLPF